MKREFVKELLKVMEENPELEVLCKVDGDIVADEGYMWWLGRLDERWGVDIDEYAELDDRIILKSDDDYSYWFECMFDLDDYANVPDEEWDEFAKKKVDELVNWEKAIFIDITTL